MPKTGTGRTVLLVEDEAGLRELAAEVLRADGYTVLTAASPGEALQAAGAHTGPIDLLLTDVIMPEMNGARLAQRIKQDRPSLKTLFLSGYPAEHVVNRGVVADGAQFLAKPFTVRALTAQVDALMGKRA